jgi:bacillithiol biosynthesis cysteine-adding enzyme BshC
MKLFRLQLHSHMSSFCPHKYYLHQSVISQEQTARGAERAAARARGLADPRSIAVVTGQQAGLFGGPLLVLYKALATLGLAQALESRLGTPVVPIFWVASDDHDFAEVRGTAALDASGALASLRYSPEVEPSGQPAARIVLDDRIETVIEDLATCLRDAPLRDFVLDRVRAAYRPAVTLADAFAHLLSSLLPDLVVLDASAPWLKGLAAPIFARELRECSETSRLASEAGARLVAAGYHQQVPVRPRFLNLFLYAEGARRALSCVEGGFEVRGTTRLLTLDQASRLLDSAPVDWSAGVLLRPLVQDFVLPTVAYVGGPAEVAYHAQIGDAYRHLGLPRPALVPRPSLTLVEPREARALEAEHLDLTLLQGDFDPILAGWAKESYPEIETAFDRARDGLRAEMARVQEALAALDPTLRAATDAAVGRALHPIESLHEKALRALKRRDVERAERLRRTRDVLFPGGSFQERALGMVAPLARHGEPLLDLLRASLDLWARGHQVIRL